MARWGAASDDETDDLGTSDAEGAGSEFAELEVGDDALSSSGAASARGGATRAFGRFRRAGSGSPDRTGVAAPEADEEHAPSPASSAGDTGERGSRTSPERAARRGSAGARQRRPPRPLPPAEMDNTERLFGFLAAGLAVFITLAVWIPHLLRAVPGPLSKDAHGALLNFPPDVAIALGFVGGALLLGATLWRRRLAVAGAALLVGYAGPWSGAYYYAVIPFLGLGMWELLRWSRLSRAKNLELRAARAGGGRGASGGRGGGGRVADSRGQRSRRTTSAAHPAPSKRYTPPKPKRRTPPPTEKPPQRSLPGTS